MGLEQGTAVSGSIIDLPHLADLTDPRLPRAFKAWNQFRGLHRQEIDRIGLMYPAEVVSLAGELTGTIAKTIGVDTESYQLSLNEQKILQLTDIVSDLGNRVIFMRHAEQSPPEWISSLPDPALRKIRMMQEPFNNQDLVTNNSFIDVFVTALTLLHIRAATGKRIRIFSSENLRAKEAAYILSIVIPGSRLAIFEGLNSIIYKNEMDEPSVTDEELLADLPSGTMPWNLELVDGLCRKPRSGRSQSEAIIRTVEGLLDYGDRKNGNKLAIVLTHTQQIAEVLKETGQSDDPYIRFPELTMLVMKNGNCSILNQGVLGSEPDIEYKTNKRMRRVLEIFGNGYEWYKIRRAEFKTAQRIPFRVSPSPFTLSNQEAQELLRIGDEIVQFVEVTDELYRTDEDLNELLDRGKPELLKAKRLVNYLFVRPDLIITPEGFSVCEIETSPFGLALAELLNRAYRLAGFQTLVPEDTLKEFMLNHTSNEGTIVYSQNTISYSGQLQFMADKILSGNNRGWDTELAENLLNESFKTLYRAFYQYEYLNDESVEKIMKLCAQSQKIEIIPSLTPHIEEKALLAVLWDRRWNDFLSRQLGISAIRHLREVVPPTWVVGQERFFLPGLPQGIETSEGIASLSRSKRNFVLKKSGFGSGSSWAEGVSFLQEKSVSRAEELIHHAAEDKTSLYVIQEFRRGEERIMFEEGDESLEEIAMRIRITPYFSMVKGSHGQLIAVKATGCERTNYIHASTGSINTAVA